jgi:two-component system chemotaxis response regulator CheB
MSATTKRRIAKGKRIRVLIVDDSVVIRRLVTQALEQDGLIEVVGVAANGAIALTRIDQLAPDLITLDVEMPEMNGLQFLAKFRSTNKDTRVIMFSTLTERGASATMDALSLGADDYVTKVSNVGSLDKSMDALRGELIPKIKQFFDIEANTGPAVLVPAPPKPVYRALAVAPQVVAIGISTGGPSALGAIMPQFPADFPLPILIVQHMPPVFTRLLAERLQTVSKIKIDEAAHGMPVEPRRAYIAPGDYHMRLVRNGTGFTIALDQAAHENSCRPAVDVMFRSVHDIFGPSVLTAVLTGMGYDGLRGAEVLKAAGSYVIAQDQATSVVWGMPGAIANAGIADAILPLERIVPEIMRLAGSFATQRPGLRKVG